MLLKKEISTLHAIREICLYEKGLFMQLKNCSYVDIVDRMKNKKIVVFGIGDFFEYYFIEHFPKELISNISYAIDNVKKSSAITIMDKTINVYSPEKLKDEQDCVVVLASSNYALQMANQLIDMNINDSIECYSFCLIMASSCGDINQELLSEVFDKKEDARIPKKLHYFWFSGDDIPEDYKKCIDSWRVVCPDYEIIEWNMNNYDWKKNKFVRQAIEAKKWAFASDYARLDVVYNQGGIYLDSDLELVKSPNVLLANKAFFSFDSCNDIDLCMLASEKENELLKELIILYDDLDFSIEKMSELCQPRLIRQKLKDFGLVLNGNAQIIDGNVFLPRNYFSPLDNFVYLMNNKIVDTIGIHHCNAGWRNNGFKKARIDSNRKLLGKCSEI